MKLTIKLIKTHPANAMKLQSLTVVGKNYQEYKAKDAEEFKQIVLELLSKAGVHWFRCKELEEADAYKHPVELSKEIKKHSAEEVVSELSDEVEEFAPSSESDEDSDKGNEEHGALDEDTPASVDSEAAAPVTEEPAPAAEEVAEPAKKKKR